MGWNERLTAWSERHVAAVDVLAAAGIAVVALCLAAVTAVVTGTASRHSPSAYLVLVVVLCAPLAWRRTAPVASFAATGLLAAAGTAAVPAAAGVAALVVPFALHGITVHGPAWAHRTALAVSVVAVPVVVLDLLIPLNGAPEDAAASVLLTLFGWVVLAAVWAFALLRRTRRERLEALQDRAERLEVERDQQTRLAAAAERARIARELHDIVAHSLSVMIAQADGGRYAAPADPAAAVRALETVSATGRDALADMRRLLGVLRADTPAGSDGAAARPAPPAADRPTAGPPGPAGPADETDAVAHAPRAPQPGIEGLEALVEQVRATGTRVSLVRVGTSRQLPPGAGLTVFRVAQEALTNVLKHAGPGPRVTVVLRWGADLVLAVEDDGRGAASDGSGEPGYGILGMRERAAVFGGTVTTGPRPGGGFAVRLVLPLRYADASDPTAPHVPTVESAAP